MNIVESSRGGVLGTVDNKSMGVYSTNTNHNKNS
jgi:hypothetical protein